MKPQIELLKEFVLLDQIRFTPHLEPYEDHLSRHPPLG